MKVRIVKIKNRKGKVDMGIKNCKKCGKEYNEKDNFKWSCRTHQSEYSGEIWWCCGKEKANQPGCKFSQHECKDDDDEGSENGDYKDRNIVKKNQRC